MAAVAALSQSAASAAPAQFQVGAASQSIAPTVPIYVGGYGLDPPTTTVHDPIEVRAMYISNGRRAVAFVVADIQAMFPAYQEGRQYGTVPLRRQAAQQIDALGGARISSSDIIFQGSISAANAAGQTSRQATLRFTITA